MSQTPGSAGDSGNPAGSSPQAASPASATPLRASQRFDTKSLKWLMNNAINADDKEYARRLYLAELFNLWRKHVATTGETYYPPLRDDLTDHYRIVTDENQG